MSDMAKDVLEATVRAYGLLRHHRRGATNDFASAILDSDRQELVATVWQLCQMVNIPLRQVNARNGLESGSALDQLQSVAFAGAADPDLFRPNFGDPDS